MSTPSGRRQWMEWQATLGGMVDAGTRVRQRCEKCDTWDEVNVVELLCFEGPDATLCERRDPCDVCGAPTVYHASPGPGTPFRPLAWLNG